MIVVDTNIIAYLFLNVDHAAQVERLLKIDPKWMAPWLWRSEFRNVLALYIRKKMLSVNDAQQIMEEAMRLLSGGEFEVISFRVLDLISQSACSAYDCEFVVLAQEFDLPLVTVDKQILREFPNTAVSLTDYLATT